MKTAIVHDWLPVYGGAERVLEQILKVYPDADVFTLFDTLPESQRHFLQGKVPRTSFLQRIPAVGRHYRKLLPLMPLAIEQLDLSGYELIISSHYAVAKGVLVAPGQVHVCYCHSPMRYAWDHYHFYLRDMGLDHGPLSWFVRWQLHRIRNWDARTALSVDHFIANSHFVRERIWKVWRREATVVHPPVDTSVFTLREQKEDFYVTAGRMVPFKRLDLVAAAFAKMPRKRLVILGDGPEMQKIRAAAGPNVEFPGFLPPAEVRDWLARARAFIFPSEEDFGIVPVEAQACGTPVLAYRAGGALETVIDVENPPAGRTGTGLFFERQTPEAICDAVERFERMAPLDAAAIAAHALDFSPENFRSALAREVAQAIAASESRRREGHAPSRPSAEARSTTDLPAHGENAHASLSRRLGRRALRRRSAGARVR